MASLKWKRIGIGTLSFLISTCILFSLLEVGFRISHSVDTKPAKSDDGEKVGLDRKTFRIVTIGESTTAPWADESRNDVSWPALLQTALQLEFDRLKLDLTVKVINRGRSAASSGFLVDGLEKEFGTLSPDLVISMMGINDSHLFSVQSSKLFQCSYLFRFIYWSLKYSDCPQCFKNSLAGVDTKGSTSIRPFTGTERNLLADVMKRLKERKVNESRDVSLPKMIDSVLRGSSPMTDAVVRLHVGINLFEYSLAKGKATDGNNQDSEAAALFSFASELFEQSLPIAGKDFPYGFEYYCHTQIRRRESCMSVALEGFRQGLRPNAALLTALSYDKNSDNPEFAKVLESTGWELSASRAPLELTNDSYRKLGDLLKNRGPNFRKPTPWIVMQYPTGRIDGVKALFFDDWKTRTSGATRLSELFTYRLSEADSNRSFEGVYFVSNENFVEKNAEQVNPNYYFRDYFGRASGLNFGHTTAAGSQLIVDNLIQQMRPYWSEIVRGK